MATLFRRAWFVEIDGLRIEGLRIQFRAEKTTKADPNVLDLKVYNLSASTRARWTDSIVKKKAPVLVVAGYEGAAEVVFYGDPRTIDHVRQGPDWVTHIQCGDGERAYVAVSSFSMAPGASVVDIFKKLSGDAGVGSKDALSQLMSLPLAFRTYQQGYAAQGPTVRELDRVARAQNLEWSIQDGNLQVLASGKVATEAAIVLSPETGLIGSPDHGKPEKLDKPAYLRCASLLQPGLRPYRRMKLETATINGFYRVEKVTHMGDSHGQEWASSVEALPL